MSSIDDVIARSRQQGTFAERRRFTVARQSAIRKMRKFALADPVYYILELIQGAVANGATYIDVSCGERFSTLSYVGGGFEEEELAQIFEFLFASKDDLDFADLRQLALGLNALMLSEPEVITIESGQGTLESTTRVVIDPQSDTIDVGTPTEALKGTYISAQGLNRNKLNAESQSNGLWDSKVREGAVIESRCLTASVPMLYNNNAIFGYRSMRSPNIFGYADTLTFDEGDLYGTIGISRTENQRIIKLLTFGVWIETVRPEWDSAVGGVVAFDRLRKTADHAGVVKDDVYRELWARLEPYKQQLTSGKRGRAELDVRRLTGEGLTAVELRELAQEFECIVVFDTDALGADRARALAESFGAALDALVLETAAGQKNTVELIVGDSVQVLQPALEQDELDFFKRSKAGPVPEPWLTSPVRLDPIPIRDVETLLEEAGLLKGIDNNPFDRWPRSKSVQLTVYTPAQDTAPGRLAVEVRNAGRRVQQGSIVSAFPGHLLMIEFPDVTSKPFFEPIVDGLTLSELIIVVLEAHALEALEQAALSVLQSLSLRETSPESAASGIILSAASRSFMKVVRRRGSSLEIRFQRTNDTVPADLLNHPVFRTVDGSPLSLRDLESMLNEQSGLLYGIVPDVRPDLEGLTTSRILKLGEHLERALIGIVGEASYIRIDRRDVLASVDGVNVRDMALGLRDFPDYPLLIEGEVESFDRTDLNALGELVLQLVALYEDEEADEEFRRQALRHLIWFMGQSWAEREPESVVSYGAAQLPLLRDAYGGALSFETVYEAWSRSDRLMMVDGWAVDVASLSARNVANLRRFFEMPALAMNPFVLKVLERLGWIQPSYELDLTEEESSVYSDRFLVKEVRDDARLRGVVGFPWNPVEHPVVSLVTVKDRRVIPLRSVAAEFGVVGSLTTDQEVDQEDVEAIETWVGRAALRLLESLAEQLGQRSGDEAVRATVRLLEFAARHVEFVRSSSGEVVFTINHGLATKILALPIFQSSNGAPVSGRRVVQAFVDSLNTNHSKGWEGLLSQEAPDHLIAWCKRMFTADAVIAEPSHSADQPQVEHPEWISTQDYEDLERWIEEALVALRPDNVESPAVRFVKRDEWGYAHVEQRKVFVGPGRLFGYELGDQTHKPLLVVSPEHPLIVDLIEDQDRKALGWLLVGTYAFINELLEEVTNEHEVEFQGRVIEYLSSQGVFSEPDRV